MNCLFIEHCLRAGRLLNSIWVHRLSGTARESAGTAGSQLKTHQLPAAIIHQTVLCVCMWHRKKSRMLMAWRDPTTIWSISCCIFMLWSTRVEKWARLLYLLHFTNSIQFNFQIVVKWCSWIATSCKTDRDAYKTFSEEYKTDWMNLRKIPYRI